MIPSDSSNQNENQNVDVILVSMPFGVLAQPSIGIGLLQGHLKSFNISSKSLHFTLTFAQMIGVELYNRVADGEPATVDLLGEWLFSAALFQNDHHVDAYIDNVLFGNNPAHRSTNPVKEKVVSKEFASDVLQIRTKIHAFLDACARQILQYQPKIVGFTSLFQQQLASLALARRLKSTNADIKIVFGGANCEGAMGAELVRQFRFVDAVVSGEADLIIKELIERLLTNQPVAHIQGVYTYDNVDLVAVNGVYVNAPSVKDMDVLPYPDYADYFQQKSMLGLEFPSNVLFETSRGCWWGHLKHCLFCGLNSLTMMFRSKSSECALAELLYLQNDHPGCCIVLVDNILDMKYFQTFVPSLAAMELDLKLFYEVKANMKKQQVQLLKLAGITGIQPGIESFSTPILDLMQKGVRALQNIQLLKWCKEFDIEPFWNFLWGFPNEDPTEYAHMAEIIPLLTHLSPPGTSQRIHLDRFSPLFDHAENYGLVNIKPYPSYFYVCPSLSANSVANIAYYFTSARATERDRCDGRPRRHARRSDLPHF
jgi:ribosomal peptide maturation radical SAM protein 1